jgi:Protein of unknown function (DUF3421)
VWQSCEQGKGPYPNNMVRSGIDKSGDPIFVGRAYFQSDLLPAKVCPYLNSTYVSYSGYEHVVTDFEVLLSSDVMYVWKNGSNGSVPYGAVKTGHTEGGEPLYTGRAIFENTLTPGKVSNSNLNHQDVLKKLQFFCRYMAHIIACTFRIMVKNTSSRIMKYYVHK